MRMLLRAIILLACLAATARAADVELVRVWPAWQDAEAFDRISEYFGGAEKHGGKTVLRTQPAERGGFYFLVRVKSASAVAGAKFEVRVIRPDHPEDKAFTFAAAIPAKESVFHLGLTGADWPGGKTANPVAWKVAVLSSDGRTLAEHKSFLWEKPAK